MDEYDQKIKRMKSEITFLQRYFERQKINGLEITEICFTIIANVFCEIRMHDDGIKEIFDAMYETIIQLKKENRKNDNGDK